MNRKLWALPVLNASASNRTRWVADAISASVNCIRIFTDWALSTNLCSESVPGFGAG